MNINDAFPSKYLKADDLKGQRVVVQIAKADWEDVGQTKDRKIVLYFTGKSKGLVCNKTNATAICDICGTAETNDWVGKYITIFPDKTEYQGKRVPCIRVDDPPKAPPLWQAAPPPPTAGHTAAHVTGVDDPMMEPPF